MRTGRSVLIAGWVCAGCSGPQSTLDPAGRGAESIAALFWWMSAAAVLIWLAVVVLAVYALSRRRAAFRRAHGVALIVGGGIAFPLVVLTALLVPAVRMLPPLLQPAPDGALHIDVAGEQWWWRVRYLPPGGDPVDLANEIRLPRGQPVEIRLRSPDVIHSFWVPALAGKMDMIPGRVTRLVLEPTRTGVFRGACAEYCGTAHALMSFEVIVLEPDAFARWLAHQAAPAAAPTEPLAVEGARLFAANGCGACHTIRGTSARGVIAPDLTHVGSRLSIGAGVLPNEPAAFVRWIAATDQVKPGVHMPPFGMLPAESLRALSVYLEGLE